MSPGLGRAGRRKTFMFVVGDILTPTRMHKGRGCASAVSLVLAYCLIRLRPEHKACISFPRLFAVPWGLGLRRWDALLFA